MRLAFFLLLLGNLAFYVWSAGYLSAARPGHEPERLTQQLHPEKVLIATESRAKPDKNAAGCRRLSGFQEADAGPIEAALASAEGFTIARQMSPASTTHRVLIPALLNRALADKKIAELRQLGVDEGKIAEDDVSGPFVVVLGIFTTEKEAQDHLGALARKGVRSARLMVRQQAEQIASFDVRAPMDVMTRLPAMLEAYPGLVLGECAPATAVRP